MEKGKSKLASLGTHYKCSLGQLQGQLSQLQGQLWARVAAFEMHQAFLGTMCSVNVTFSR